MIEMFSTHHYIKLIPDLKNINIFIIVSRKELKIVMNCICLQIAQKSQSYYDTFKIISCLRYASLYNTCNTFELLAYSFLITTKNKICFAEMFGHIV